jgi:hypothetical protein
MHELESKYDGIIRQKADYKKIIFHLAAELQQDFSCARVSIFLKHQDGRFVTVIAQGVAGMDIDVKPGEGIAGKCLQRKLPLIVNNSAYDPRSLCRVRDHYTGYHTANLLAAPMLNIFHQPIGIIQLVNKCQGDFTETDANRLEGLCNSIRDISKIVPQPITNIWDDDEKQANIAERMHRVKANLLLAEKENNLYVLDVDAGRVHSFNPTARIIFQLCMAGGTKEEIVQDYIRYFNISTADGQKDVDVVLKIIGDYGLFADG